MKTLVGIIAAFLVTIIPILTLQVYGIPPIAPQVEYVNSDVIVIGKVISAVPYSSTQMKYQIQVEQYLKNPQNQDIITIIADGTNKTLVDQGLGPDTVYDVGQRALLYLKNESGNYVAWYFSHSTDSLCDPAPTKEDLNFSLSRDAGFAALPAYSPLHVETGIPYLFRVDDTILMHYDAWNRHFTTKTFDVEFDVKNVTTGELLSNVTKQIELKPCIGHQTVNATFTPKNAGTYEIDAIFDNSLLGTTVEVKHNFSDVKLEKGPFLFPLQQYRLGTAAKDVVCKEGLQLMIKAPNDFPVCLKPSNAAKLSQRGWNLVSYKDYNLQSTVLENSGVVTLKNQTYYFGIPIYTNNAYVHSVQISFHDVLFTLFPSGFRGGLPVGGCAGQYYWADAKFADDTHELLHVFAGSQSCGDSNPIMLSSHVEPQAGLTFYDGKLRLLVKLENQGKDIVLQKPSSMAKPFPRCNTNPPLEKLIRQKQQILTDALTSEEKKSGGFENRTQNLPWSFIGYDCVDNALEVGILPQYFNSDLLPKYFEIIRSIVGNSIDVVLSPEDYATPL